MPRFSSGWDETLPREYWLDVHADGSYERLIGVDPVTFLCMQYDVGFVFLNPYVPLGVDDNIRAVLNYKTSNGFFCSAAAHWCEVGHRVE